MLKPSLPSSSFPVSPGAARFGILQRQLFVKKTNKKSATNMDVAKSSNRDHEPSTNSHPGPSDSSSPQTKQPDGHGQLPRQDSIPVAQRADGLGRLSSSLNNVRHLPLD